MQLHVYVTKKKHYNANCLLCIFLICRAQSVTWNPHKLMGALLQCSTIHFREDVSIKKFFSRLMAKESFDVGLSERYDNGLNNNVNSAREGCWR